MEKKIILLFILISIIFLSGCIDQDSSNGGPQRYKNDIITIEHYTVTDAEPYARSSTSIDFYLQNNGDEILDEVKVNFFDITCSNLKDFGATLICNEETGYDRECVFKDIEPSDWKRVTLDIRTPDVSSITPCTFSFSVSYDYSGGRDITMPIIDGVTIEVPLGKFDPGVPTYGPIVLDVEAPVGRITTIDSQEIKEHWGIIGRPFKFTMKFRYANDVTIKSSEPVNISKDNIKLSLIGVSIAKSNGEPLYCDFEENMLSKKNVIVTADSEDSGELICNFQSDSGEAEVDAHIGVIFSYRYKFIVSTPIEIQPIS